MDAGFAPDIGMIAYFPKITANSSFEIGFVSKVVEGGREEVVIAEKTPIGVLSAKRLLNHARDHT
ncbi:hypothetical protein BT96DRAFT_928307 [Gymnopus androsaceus JB14]|uniref:Uncharacterized protein n=1 Tax=Gymnopus androsaceus JB14 TaxID=1447944 RepID=A0A6A4GM35_9AGAR|nr:hypothetical protein BT96DRAFT_928307 [Gymnopus androsaceus JB14]